MLLLYSYKNFSKKSNSTKTPGGSIVPDRHTVAFKDATSMDTPTIIFQSGDILQRPEWTYVHMPQLGAYYFVDEIKSIRTGQWEIRLSIDPLASYKEYILDCVAFIAYASDGYNESITDTRIASHTPATTLVSRSELTGMSKEGTTILICMSDGSTSSALGGLASAYSVNNANINLIREGLTALYNDKDLSDKIKNAYKSPFDAFLTAYWIPFSATTFGGNSERITIGGYQFGNGYVLNSPYVEIDQVVEIPHAYRDFRASEPYSSYNLRLPVVGTVSLPSDICAKNSSITISGRYDYMGNISYDLRSEEDGTFASFGGNCSIQLPISVAATGNGMGVVSGISEAAGGAMQVLGGIAQVAAGNPMSAAFGVGNVASGASSIAMGISNAINSSQQKMYMSRGSLSGGAASCDPYIDITCVYHTTSSLNMLAETLGRTVMSVGRVGDHTGYVQTRGCSIDCPCEEPVRSAINAMLDGGIYIE